LNEYHQTQLCCLEPGITPGLFVPDGVPVWRACVRVPRQGGRLLAGVMHPRFYLFDHDQAEQGGPLVETYPPPYEVPESLPAEARRRLHERGCGTVQSLT